MPFDGTFYETKELIEKARDLLARPNGWCQGRSTQTVNIDGHYVTQYCMMGALNEASFRFPAYTRQSAFEMITEAAGGSKQSFNDFPLRTQEEVVAVFDKVIADL